MIILQLINSLKLLNLKSTSNVKGDVVTGKLGVEPGSKELTEEYMELSLSTKFHSWCCCQMNPHPIRCPVPPIIYIENNLVQIGFVKE